MTAQATLLAIPARNAQSTDHLIVADGLCPQIAELLPGALHELVALGHSANPLAAITQELERRRLAGKQVDTLHIVAHGRPGAFQIGGQWVDSAALIANADQLAQWQVGAIALWSCYVGADAGFVALLEELSGAEVHASQTAVKTNRTKTEDGWRLEDFSSSNFNRRISAPFNSSTIQAWLHTLATVNFTGIYRAIASGDSDGLYDIQTQQATINTAAISNQNPVTFTDGATGVTFNGNNISGTLT